MKVSGKTTGRALHEIEDTVAGCGPESRLVISSNCSVGPLAVSVHKPDTTSQGTRKFDVFLLGIGLRLEAFTIDPTENGF
jgi:hypothetical protein